MRRFMPHVLLFFLLFPSGLFARGDSEGVAQEFHLNYALDQQGQSATLVIEGEGAREATFKMDDPPEFIPLASDLVASLELNDGWEFVISNNNDTYFDGSISINNSAYQLLIPPHSDQLFALNEERGRIIVTTNQVERGPDSAADQFFPPETSKYDQKSENDDY